MLRYEDVKAKKSRFLALTGLNVEEFENLLVHFQESFNEHMEMFTIDGKRREYRSYSTYKRTPLPEMADKLLFILVFLKHNLHQEVQGSLFGLSQTNVSKWNYVLHTVLNTTLARQNYLPARTPEDLSAYLQKRGASQANASDDVTTIPPHQPPDDTIQESTDEQRMASLDAASFTDQPQPDSETSARANPPETAPPTDQTSDTVERKTDIFFQDGTERPIGRPRDPFEQEDHYSGKKKQHTLKSVIIADETARVDFLSKTRGGPVHDKRIADESAYKLPKGSILYQDTGFQGFVLDDVTIIQPKKKPKGKELTLAEKEENRCISSVRIFIEHVICSVKRYRVVKDKLRLWKGNIRDKVMETCVGLHNFRITFRPLRKAENKS